MSCGNRFQCGLRKPSRFSFQPDRPSNPELHNENQKRLNDLMKMREEQDKGQFQPKPVLTEQVSLPDNFPFMPIKSEQTNTFTPWSTPSTTAFTKNNNTVIEIFNSIPNNASKK